MLTMRQKSHQTLKDMAAALRFKMSSSNFRWLSCPTGRPELTKGGLPIHRAVTEVNDYSRNLGSALSMPVVTKKNALVYGVNSINAKREWEPFGSGGEAIRAATARDMELQLAKLGGGRRARWQPSDRERSRRTCAG
jgi:hypothetical protein